MRHQVRSAKRRQFGPHPGTHMNRGCIYKTYIYTARRTRHYEEVREQLEKERDRILKHLLPKRHAMSGDAQAFPICVEVRLPGGAS